MPYNILKPYGYSYVPYNYKILYDMFLNFRGWNCHTLLNMYGYYLKIPLAYTIYKSIWLPHMWPYAYENLYGLFTQHIFMRLKIPYIFLKIYGYSWKKRFFLLIMPYVIYIIVWLNLMWPYVYDFFKDQLPILCDYVVVYIHNLNVLLQIPFYLSSLKY
jgi:hypothetical protein